MFILYDCLYFLAALVYLPVLFLVRILDRSDGELLWNSLVQSWMFKRPAAVGPEDPLP